MSNGTTSSAPRLCHVIKVDNFDGYGFNLHAEKGKPGQYIGKVDEGSPAEKAGLHKGDRIIEVNGESIANENHKQVVQRIKALPNETRLLVVTPGPDEELPNLDVPDSKIEDANKNQIHENNGTLKESKLDMKPNNEPAPKLNLQMTAAEMRAQLAAKKKFDPKKVPMDLKSKFDIVKKL